jgi:putative endonuclease
VWLTRAPDADPADFNRDERPRSLPVISVMAGLVPAIPIPDTRTMKPGYVYILASRPGGAIYVVVTSNLVKRLAEHKGGLVLGHTKRYGIDKLVHFETYDDIRAALQREKNIKHWPRAYKTRLILQANPTWRDLYEDVIGPPVHP